MSESKQFKRSVFISDGTAITAETLWTFVISPIS